MVDFEEAKHIALEALAEIVTVNPMSEADRKIVGLQKYSTVYRISTEVFILDNTVKSIVLLMALPNEFPLELPRIYISKEDSAWIGFIPHVNVKGYVCLFDEESIIIDFDRPGEIVKTCLSKSLLIIEQGLKRENQNDFSDEFVAYWIEKYDEKDEIYSGLMMLEKVPGQPPCQVRFLIIENSYSGYQAILYDQGKAIKRFKDFLNKKGYSIKEDEGIYLGSIKSLNPPFNFSNADIYQIVKDYFPQSQKEFERYINQAAGYRLIVFSVISRESHLFFGWHITQLNMNRNGYRTGSLTPLNVFNTFQRNDRVIRLQFDAYTKERLTKRTDGTKSTTQYEITFAGLGSIGSSLLPNLIPLGIDTLHLIDPDILTLANINRHLLGPDDIGRPKVEGIRDYLHKGDPLFDITIHRESVIQYVRNKTKILNQSNYLFIAIGKNVVENYILQSLYENQITIPTFVIWIEPYLIGGHCLYLQPGNPVNYNNLYENHLFRYNIVNASEYQSANNQLLFREAGCQGSFIPYGQKSVTLFLAALVQYLFQIIDNKDTRNLALTWRGKVPDNISLEFSSYGKHLQEGNIQLNEL